MTDPEPQPKCYVNPGASVAQLMQDATEFAAAGDLALAHAHWQAACVLAPDNNLAALRLAQSLHGFAGPVAARDALIALVQRIPAFIPARLGLVRQLIKMKDHLSALCQTDIVLRDNPDHPAALILRADCLHQLRRDPEAVDDLTRALLKHPDIPSPRLKLAALYLGMGRFDRVLALCDGLVSTDNPLTNLQLLGARAQFRLGHRTDATTRFLALLNGGPEDVIVRRAQIQEHLGALDFAGAYDHIADLLTRHPDDLAGYALAMHCLSNLDQYRLLWQVLGNAPLPLRQSRQFQLTVMLPASQSQFRVEDCRAIIAAHDADDLPIDQCLPLIEAHWVHGDRQLAYARLSDLQARFPDDLAVMRKSITVFGSRSPQQLRQIKAGCLDRLSPLECCQFLAGLKANVLTPAERQSVLQWTLEAGVLQTEAQHRHFLLGFLHETDAGVIDALLAGYRGPAPFFALMTPILAARSASQTRPGAESDTHGHSRISLRTAELARNNAAAPAPLRHIASALTGLLSASDGPSWMDSAEVRAAALGLCDWLAERIRHGQPTSVIRIGDGEGRFLPYPLDQQDVQADDQAQVQRDPWWGAELLNRAQADRLSAGLMQAIANADVLGIPPMSRLGAEFGWATAFHHRDCRGLTAIFDHLKQQRAGGLFGSCNLHADLDRWGLYGRMLAECKSVSVVSCHDLSAILAQKFHLATRIFYQIPGEYRYRRNFADQTAVQNAARIYPETFDTIMAQLDPVPGEVHLVAAGFLGKLFCDRIRAKGGIAIDIGSQADSWANHTTRAYFISG